MTSAVTISCILNTTDPTIALGFEAWIDNTKFVDINHVQTLQAIQIEIPNSGVEHELKFVLKNKTKEHTQIDETGNIVSDAVLTIADVAFDKIKLGNTLTELATYIHDFNGFGKTIQEKFHGVMGCNGTVSLKFSTPIYLWLLEHM